MQYDELELHIICNAVKMTNRVSFTSPQTEETISRNEIYFEPS